MQDVYYGSLGIPVVTPPNAALLTENPREPILLVESDLLPMMLGAAFQEFRKACPKALVIIIGYLEARQQTAFSAGADAFISKGETPECVATHLQAIAAGIPLVTARSG